MSEKTLVERGAECIAGDLILNRKIVGKYRNGQFIITPEGVEEVNNVVEVQATEVSAPAPRAPKAPKAPKNAKAADVTDVTPVEVAPASVDGLLDGLDAALGE